MIFKSIFLSLFIVFCSFFLITTIQDLSYYKVSGNWPTTRAEITISEVKKCGKGSSKRPIVEYKYIVDNKNYTSQKLIFGSAGCGDGITNDVLEKYQVGDFVNILYDPEFPQRAVLIADKVFFSTWLILIMMPTFIISIPYYWYIDYKKQKLAKITSNLNHVLFK